MTLLDGKIGAEYSVKNINLEEKVCRRFEILGMTVNSKVFVVNKSLNGSMVIKIRGTRFALGKQFAKGIEIFGKGA